MSVLLVNPPALARAPARIATPPMGLAYLCASIEAEGISASVLDAEALRLSPGQVAQKARDIGPRIIGVTSITPLANAAYATLEALRPEAGCLVIGGAHPSAIGAEVFEQCPVPLDAAVCGEAEETFPLFAKKVLSGESPQNVEMPGVIVPGRAGPPGDWPRVEDIDRLPFPQREGLPNDRYRHPLFGGERVTAMITSRGCPYKCVFCDKHVCGSRWRARSPLNVLEEIESIALKTRTRSIIIYDDLFTLRKERVIQICKMMVEKRMQIRWKCEGRVNRVDTEMLGWMRKAGCEVIAYGVETAGTKGLEFLGKDITPGQVREAFAMAREAGIKTLGYFLLGIPGETLDEEMETVRFAIELGADYAQFGVLTPFPGTPLYQQALEKGWVHEMPARGPAELGERRQVLLDGYWTMERLDHVVRTAHRKFYFRPGYLIKRIKNVRSARELAAAAAQAARLAVWMAERPPPNKLDVKS